MLNETKGSWFQMRSRFMTALVAIMAVLVLGSVSAASALASPEWHAKKGGVWEKLTSPLLHVSSEFSVELTDKKGAAGQPLTIACKLIGNGSIGAGGAGKIESVTVESCTAITENCGVAIKAKAENLPWVTELYAEGGKVRDRIVSPSEEKTPDFVFKCSTGNDFCGINTTVGLTNNSLTGNVEAAFEEKSNKTKCSIGGSEAGVWKGGIVFNHPSGTEAIKAE